VNSGFTGLVGKCFKFGVDYFLVGDCLVKRKRKMPHVDTDEVERKEKQPDTMDIYNEKDRDEMLEEDEITAAEDAFMEGREMKVGKKKKDLMLEEKDTESVELAKEDYRDD